MQLPGQAAPAHIKGLILAFVGGLVISFDIPTMRLAHGEVWSILATRSGATAILTLATWLVMKLLFRRAPVLIPGWAGLAVAVLYGSTSVVFLVSVFNTSTANVVFILAFNPMFSGLLSWIFLKERPSVSTIITMAVMTCGVAVIVAGSLEGGHIFGDLMAATSAFLAAAALTISRAVDRDFGFTPLVATVIPAIFGGVMAMISGYHIVEPGWVVLNGLTITPIAFWALAAAPRYMPAAETAMFYLLETVLAPVWVWLIFRETPALPTLIGGSIIIAALAAHSLARMLGKTDIEPA